MLTGFVIFCHAIVCLLLTSIILLQSGRGGGLTESFASASDMFGAQTNTFLIKGTSILATFFLITCLGLAFLSARKSESLMSGQVAPVAVQSSMATEEVQSDVVVAEDLLSEEPVSLELEADEAVETLGENFEDVSKELPESLPEIDLNR